MTRPIRILDLCCGAGGWACAARGLPFQWVAVADLAADCLETWQLNHGATHPACALLCGDLTQKDVQRQILAACAAVGGVDVVVGAIPCEALSCARANRSLKPGELEATQDLIAACFALVKKLKPRWWCFEDVIGVEAHLPWPHFEPGILPYECRRIDSSLYGPQKRIRTFFGAYPDLAAPAPGPRTLGEVLRPGPYRTLPLLKKYQRSKSKWYGNKMRVQDVETASATVISSQGGAGSRSERSGMVPVCRIVDPAKPSPTVLAQQGKGGAGNDGTHLVPLKANEVDQPSNTVFAGQHGQSTRSVESLLVPLARVLDSGEACPTVADFSSRHERAALVNAQARNLDADAPAPTVTSSGRCDERTVPLFQRERPADPAGASPTVCATSGGREAPVELRGREKPSDPAAPGRTVISGHKGEQAVAQDEGLVRVMEWQEAALLMGFPTDYIFAASWSRTWKLVAQAISIHVGRAILQGMVARWEAAP